MYCSTCHQPVHAAAVYPDEGGADDLAPVPRLSLGGTLLTNEHWTTLSEPPSLETAVDHSHYNQYQQQEQRPKSNRQGVPLNLDPALLCSAHLCKLTTVSIYMWLSVYIYVTFSVTRRSANNVTLWGRWGTCTCTSWCSGVLAQRHPRQRFHNIWESDQSNIQCHTFALVQTI